MFVPMAVRAHSPSLSMCMKCARGDTDTGERRDREINSIECVLASLVEIYYTSTILMMLNRFRWWCVHVSLLLLVLLEMNVSNFWGINCWYTHTHTLRRKCIWNEFLFKHKLYYHWFWVRERHSQIQSVLYVRQGQRVTSLNWKKRT